MPQQTFEIKAPNGRTLSITGDHVPNEAELQAIFKQAGVETGGPAAAAPASGAPHTEADPNTFGTFLKHLWSQVNPVEAARSVMPLPTSLGGRGVDAPVQAFRDLSSEQQRVYHEAADAWHRGDRVTALRKGLDWLASDITMGASLSLDKAGDHAGQGRYAAAAGDTFGLAGSMVAPEAARMVRESGPVQRLAPRADAAADAAFADTLTPKGSSKAIQRTGKQAFDVAADVRRGTTAITPEGVRSQIAERLSDAGENLESAYGQIPKTKPYQTSAIIKGLQASRDALKVRGSGGAMTSEAVIEHAAALDQAIAEVKKLGPVTNIDNLVRLRNQWKQPASNAFVPELNPNFQQIRNSAKGWADAWGAVQDVITSQHPELKPLNADYRIWKQASDVVQALEDQQRVKPTVGRTIMAQGMGAIAGHAVDGGYGAAVGAIVAPLIERGISTKLGPSVKLGVARKLGDLADAIRSSNPTAVEQILRGLRPLVLIEPKPMPSHPVPVLMQAAAPDQQETR